MLKTFMKSKFNFIIVSITIFIFSIITICCAPIINKIYDDFENWKSLNCGIFSDLINSKDIGLNDYENYKYLKSLCQRQKSMYDLEYISLIFSTTLSFICFCLSLFIQLEIGTNYKNKIGLFSFFSGIICFILTFIYVCYSGYIFTNDTAYLELNLNYGSLDFITSNVVQKLYSNGASRKWDGQEYVTDYENGGDTLAGFIKYKDLGKSEYNYDSDYYKKYRGYIETTGEIYKCQESRHDSSCEYIYHEPATDSTNKELYDRWLTALILACVTTLFNLLLAFFGVCMFANFGNSFLN